MLLRPARDDESALLSDLALRSKGHWGYDADFLESCRAELTLTPELLIEERAQVAERDGRVVGFYTLAGRSPEGQLGHMFVEPDHVNKGIGRRLWEHALDTAATEGIRRILIEADRTPRPSTSPWARSGWVRCRPARSPAASYRSSRITEPDPVCGSSRPRSIRCRV